MALLVHELTHIYQLRKLHDFPFDTHHNTASSLNNTWEQEALDNEQFTYELLTNSNKLYQKGLPYSNIHATYDNNMVSSIGPPYRLANSYGINDEYDDNNLNNAKMTSIDLTTILEMISKKNSSFEQLSSSLNEIESYKHPTVLPSVIPIINPDLFPSNKNPYLTNASSFSLAYNYPDLSFGSISNSSKNEIVSITTNTATNNSANSNYYDISGSNNSSSYPVAPLFAERNRNIDLNSALGSDSSQHTVMSPPPPMDNLHSSNIVNLDIETIAEKVYQILHSKIKIQRARRGMR